jgi:hypothetical protein
MRRSWTRYRVSRSCKASRRSGDPRQRNVRSLRLSFLVTAHLALVLDETYAEIKKVLDAKLEEAKKIGGEAKEDAKKGGKKN